MKRKQLPKFTQTKIYLVKAIPEDLKELDYYENLDNDLPVKKRFRLKLGIPYWIMNPFTKQLDTYPYRTTSSTDLDEIAKYLKEGTIYIYKNYFKNEI